MKRLTSTPFGHTLCALFLTPTFLMLTGCPVEPSTNNSAACSDVTVYPDEDGDGYGVLAGAKTMCLKPGELVEGFARKEGDCAPQDIMQHPGAEGICGDGVDDNCDGSEIEMCPESQVASIINPAWDCVNGTIPNSVYAYARITDGKGYFKKDACFIFFEGVKDNFYVKTVGMEPIKTGCEDEEEGGCTCPSTEGPSYDQRLYAYTLNGPDTNCPEVSLPGFGIDGVHIQQPLSNNCRKFLVPLYANETPYFHVSQSINALESRIATYSKLEVACAAAPDCEGAVWASLISTEIVRNPNFIKQ